LIQKKTDFHLTRSEAGKKPIILLGSKAYYPASADVGQRKHLVSVLDLDNSVRFSWHTSGRPRKQPCRTLASPRRVWHQTEIIALLGAIKQC
jgi:hypothetical protein